MSTPSNAASPNLDAACRLLKERYPKLGERAAEFLGTWLSGKVPYAYPEIIEKHLSEEHIPLLFDSFWQVLPFGTGGRRGKVGYGPNRLNPTSIALTIQGHCRFLRERFATQGKLRVLVGNDVRVFRDVAGTYRFLGDSHPLLGVSARSLARLACEIYAGNGITAYLAEPENDQAFLSTPELSFLVRQLDAVGGVMLSASHNPPDDNGIKLYDDHGSQPVAPEDQHLLDIMATSTSIQAIPFAEAFEHGLIRPIKPELHDRYVQAYVSLYAGFEEPGPSPPIVFTPLCGCGLSTAGDVLKTLGFDVRTPPGEGPDGSFAAIPLRSPNPEVEQSTEPARRFADEISAEIVLSSDPDADRVGLEAKRADGSWFHFDGNQIAAILGYALMLDPAGPRRSGLVIETLVTTRLLSRIATLRGESPIVEDLLVGFKYVADILKKLESEGRYASIQAKPEDLVLAAEESHGVCMLPAILDKDATPACLFLAGLSRRLKREGKTFLDYYDQILDEVGPYDSVGRSLTMSGAEGVLKRDRIMEWFRDNLPDQIADAPVKSVVDHWNEERFGDFVSDSDRLPRNVIEVMTERFVLIARPSGTEPKVKLYCHLLPGGAPSDSKGESLRLSLREEVSRLARKACREVLLSALKIELGEAGLLLPDIIDVDKKVWFEQKVLPELDQKLGEGSSESLDTLLDWLRSQSASLLPGADALPALKASLAWVCEKRAPSPLSRALAEWAKR